MSKQFFSVNTIPDPEKEPEFYEFVNSKYYKICVNYLILNAIRSGRSEVEVDSTVRSRLAKMEALQELFDLPEWIEGKLNDNSIEEEHEELN